MLTRLHNRKRLQLTLGFLAGIVFGFLLQKGGATKYDVILGQLLLTDFTVLKIMLTTVVVGMIGIYGMRALGWVGLHKKPGSVSKSVIGGLLFGIGFAVLGYCPGTLAGAVGQGNWDALVGGVTGMLLGTGLYAAIYPKVKDGILKKGWFGEITLPELVKQPVWIVVPVVCVVILGLFYGLESLGY